MRMGTRSACKAGDGKVIAAFPDVCLTPPPPPAGPIPVPYPDTSFSKDMKNGSKTVKIRGQEIMLKDQSFYKTSPLGDEAATNGQGAGVTTHVITGQDVLHLVVDGREVRGPERRPPYGHDHVKPRQPDGEQLDANDERLLSRHHRASLKWDRANVVPRNTTASRVVLP